jgi:DNA-directed RNA polymerase II subunit RPB2
VFLNGKWIGVHRNPDELKSALLKLRRSASITEDVSIVYDHALGEIRIYNDWGRVCRPLYVVENNTMKLTKGDIPQLSVCPCLSCLIIRQARAKRCLDNR